MAADGSQADRLSWSRILANIWERESWGFVISSSRERPVCGSAVD
jgi:hypothetical protein